MDSAKKPAENQSWDPEGNFPISSQNPLLDILVRFLKGAVIGIGGILPGISGGVLAVVFGVYKAILHFLSHLTRHFWKQFSYLLPVLLGIFFGVLAFSGLISTALLNYEAQSISVFLGFAAGTIPSLYRQAGEKGRTTSDLWLLGLVTLAFSFFMIFFSSQEWMKMEGSFPVWIFSGALIALGALVPGMSPSNFLLYFGLYEKMAAGVARLDWSILIPLGIGYVLCLLLLAQLVNWLFRKYYSKMSHFILAMVTGSTIAIFFTNVLPIWQASLKGFEGGGWGVIPVSILLFIAGAVATWRFSDLEKRYQKDKTP